MGAMRMGRRWLAGMLVAGLLGPGAARAQTAQDSLEAVHLLRRATFGVRPEDVAEVLRMGRTAWLERQLSPAGPDTALQRRLAAFPAASASVAVLVSDYTPSRAPADSLRRAGGRESMADSAAARRGDPGRRRGGAMADSAMAGGGRGRRGGGAGGGPPRVMGPQQILVDLVGAKLTRAVWSERQLEEVMTDFWFNHFNVYWSKSVDRYLVGDYERTAIRPYVFGRFEDMVRATAQHPAMLFYLDNWTSASPDSAGDARRQLARQRLEERLRAATPAQRAEMVRRGRITQAQLDRLEANNFDVPPVRTRGINENYARELLELHTLGVDGGYTQQDVIEVARALTGWTFNPPDVRGRTLRPGDAEFIFRAQLHDRGEKVVLGQTLPAGRGIEDGLDVIRMVSRHPSTARHIATKLIERFVSDEPDPAFVAELAAVFTRTDGDLREVTRALFTSPRFYEAKHIGTKIKTPFEVVASGMRVVGAEVTPSRRLLDVLRSLGQLPYNETTPAGFPAASAEWVNSAAMLGRMNFGLDLAAGRLGVRPDPDRFADLRDSGPPGVVHALVTRLLPGMDTAELEAAVIKDLEARAAEGETRRGALGARMAGLVLGSPAFQRR